ncbi:MAG: cbs domain containing protein, partial [Candidatus Nephrothrix sp. EaCA]
GNHHLHSVAVVDDGQKYVGLITLLDIMAFFAQSASVQMHGSILVLSMELVDYSLAEICRYVEEN